LSCGPKARCWYVYRTRVVRAIAEHGAAGLNLKVSIDFSAATGLLQFDRYARTHIRHLMNKNHIRHLPVIDNYSLIGVISVRDISAAFDDEATAAARSLSAA
jgi:hypothetical protein